LGQATYRVISGNSKRTHPPSKDSQRWHNLTVEILEGAQGRVIDTLLWHGLGRQRRAAPLGGAEPFDHFRGSHEAAANVEPYIRADDTRIWSLMLPERQLRLEAFGRRRRGYLDRRRTSAADS
jgi:hypothetical protein